MNLLRLYVIGVALCGAILLHAQTQQGYVKTLGRPNQKGQALSGVTIRVKGGHNAVLSSSDGAFALTLIGKKLGESYQLQQVQKQGYELVTVSELFHAKGIEPQEDGILYSRASQS